MPKFGAHIIIAELAQQRRKDLFNGMDNALRLGGVGPDLTLFLFDPVTDPTIRKGYQAAVDVLIEVRKIKKTLKNIEIILNKPNVDLQDWLTGHVSDDLRDTLELAIEAMLLAAKLGLANGASSFNIQNPLARLIATGQIPADLLKDPAHAAPTFLVDSTDNFGFPLRYFGHPLTDDGKWKSPEPTGNYSNWWWMDMLHYRKTGTFAKTLLSLADDPIGISYARGYMSHVAGDICGHPFINALVGGPFRNHAYRHMVLESLADTWLWNHQGRGDIIDAGLDQLILLSDGDFHKISTLIVKSMKAVYSGPMLPNRLPGRYPDTSELAAAYRAMLIYLDLSTSGSLPRPMPPPDDPRGLLQEIQDLLSRNAPTSPPSWNPNNPLDYIVALLGYLLRGVVFLAMLATLPEALVIRFLNIAPRWMLYLIKLAIYMVISGLRTLLAFMGWGYAGREDFETFAFLESMVTTRGQEDSYPRAGIARPKPPYYWLLRPAVGAPAEPNSTVVGPIPRGSTPAWLVDPHNQLDPKAIATLLAARTPAETIKAESAVLSAHSNGFGNAVDFCNALLDKSIPVPDLDLDGDRGFGFKSWEELPPKERYL